MNRLKIMSIAVLFITLASSCATTIVAGDDGQNNTTSAPHANDGIHTNSSNSNYVIQQNTRDESGLKSGRADDTTVKEIQISK